MVVLSWKVLQEFSIQEPPSITDFSSLRLQHYVFSTSLAPMAESECYKFATIIEILT
ncbi:hypothetical protein Fmac_001383 [Flemingia macrophylla]|uniref:Uncharacterized protein n=1 Tax=Flemingia macrophylla TaxID=520843 RepID=A0ABD1NGX4_9FABA